MSKNNKKPYCWEEFNSDRFFGQECVAQAFPHCEISIWNSFKYKQENQRGFSFEGLNDFLWKQKLEVGKIFLRNSDKEI